MLLRFLGMPHTEEYRASDLDGVWYAGEARHVSEVVGRRLLADHPTAFAVEAIAPALTAPPKDRKMRGAR
jgi:hypothetical protein